MRVRVSYVVDVDDAPAWANGAAPPARRAGL
jgi:hypothetical protein